MHAIIHHHDADRFVIATGQAHSVRDLCHEVFRRLDLDYRAFVVHDQRYLRREQLRYLRGDATRARTTLPWQPRVTFGQMVDERLEHSLAMLPDRRIAG